MRAVFLALFLVTTHGRVDAASGSVRCETSHTRCRNKFSGASLGCCPLQDAVCCSNLLTCCPHESKCVDYLAPGWPDWAVTTVCVPLRHHGSAKFTWSSGLGVAVCKPGPKQEMDPKRHNVVVIGDSVSIGYTPFLAAAVRTEALVQHAPWGGDGGAEETAYGVQCLDYFLRSPNGRNYAADLIIFNFGLHDGIRLFSAPPGNVTIPGQEGLMAAYAKGLRNITARLKAHQASLGAKLLFVTTTPMLCKARDDSDVSWLNTQARAIMAEHGVDWLDLHAAVVKKCGHAPQAKCWNSTGAFCPHAPDAGYRWLAESTIAPAVRDLLRNSAGARAKRSTPKEWLQFI